MSALITPRGTRPPISAPIALALALALAACSKKDAAGADSAAAAAATGALVLGPQDVVTAQAGGAAASGGLTLSGPLEPGTRVTIRAQVPGTIQGLTADRGTRVARGQVLASISAEGVRSQAAGAQAGVAAANAQLAVARQRLEAARTLRQAGAMSEIDYRTAQATFESAEAQVAAARAQAASAGEAAGFTRITAPISGVVSDRMVEQGEAVNPGAELLTIVDARTLELEGSIGVEDAARVRVGQPVAFALDAFPGEAFRGRVARVDPTADPGTRQVRVYVELANANGRIIGGQFARGTIAVGGAAGAAAAPVVTVPATAVLGGAGGDGSSGAVFVVSGGRLARRAVTLGARDEAAGTVQVRSGLAAGERVIAVPSAELREGTQVTVAADAAAGGSTVPAAPGGR